MRWRDNIVKVAGPIAKALSLPPLRKPFERVSYSAYGEDRIVLSWLERHFQIDSRNVRYCDIGANHPMDLSNTFLFYSMGGTGVLVEPDPNLGPQLRQSRPRDVVLGVAVAFDDRRTGKLKRLTSNVFNTFSPAHATAVAEGSKSWRPDQKQHVLDEIEVPLIPANDILAGHFGGGLDFLSIDAEGVDLQIVRSIDFDRFRPKVLCFEGHDIDEAQKALPARYELIARTPDNLICISDRR